MNWPGIPFCGIDYVTRWIHRALETDPVLRTGTGGRIFRYDFYSPSAFGAYPRIIVAPLQSRADGIFSKTLKGEHSIGVICEWESKKAMPSVADNEPTIASVLDYARSLIFTKAKHPQDDEGRRITRGTPTIETISFTPSVLPDGVVYFVGLVLVYSFVENAPV